MKKCCNHKRPDRASHVMETKHDMGKLMSKKANNSDFREGQHKDLAGLKCCKMPGGK